MKDAPLETVAGWRAQAPALRFPVQFAVIEALARKAGAQQGLVRQVLQQRLAARWAALQAQDEAHSPATGTPPVQAPEAGLAALRKLLRAMNPPAASTTTANGAPGTAPAAAARPPQAMSAYQATWSRLRAEQRLRQALAQVPAQAGPLNSSQLVHRALRALHEDSPAYLDAFMRHVDTLLALEQASGLGEAALRPAAPGEGRRAAAAPLAAAPKRKRAPRAG